MRATLIGSRLGKWRGAALAAGVLLAVLLAMPTIALGAVWTVKGVAADASSSQAVPGAWVSAVFWDAGDVGFEYYDEMQTGTQGSYELNYSGWRSTDCEVWATANHYRDSYESLSFDGVSTLVKDFALQPNALAFEGFITDATTAKTIGGASVSAYFCDPIDGIEYSDWDQSAADGSYHLYLEPAATYEVSVTTYRYDDATEHLAFDGTSVVSKDIALRPSKPAFKGTVTDTETAQAIPGAQVSALFTDGNGDQYWDEATTTVGGTYELYPCGPAGEYKIWVSAPLYARTAATAYFDGAKTVSQDFGMLTINRPPTAVGDSRVTDEDSNLRVGYPGVLANDWDVNHDSLTAERVTEPAHGLLSFYSDGAFYYSPYVNFFGVDVFTYRAKDPSGRYSLPVEVRIQVTAVNDAPVSADDDALSAENATISRDQATGVLANDADIDSLMTAELVAAPAHGTLVLRADGSYVYTPITHYCGVDTFSYRAKDSEGLYSAPATVTITLKSATATLLRITSTSGLLADWTAPYVMTGKLNTLPSGAAVSRRRVYAQIATSKNGPFKDTSWAGLTTPNGSFRFPVYFSGRAYLRVVFAGDDLRASTPSGSSSYLPSQSGTVVRSTKPAGVGNPIAPRTMRVGRYAKVYGDLYPHHTAGQNVVRIYRYRLVKGKWRNYGYANAKSIVYWPQTRYVASVKLPYRGRWRLRTYHPADSMRPGRWSDGSDFVTVR